MKKIKLKYLFILLLLFGVTLPVVTIWLVTYKIVQDRVRDEIYGHMTLEARFVAEAVHRFQGRAVQELEKITELLFVERLAPPDKIDRFLDRMRGEKPVFESLYLVGRRGLIENLAPFEEDKQGNDVTGLEIYQQALKTPGPVWGEVFISQSSGNPTVPLALTRNGKMIIGFLDLSRLASQFKWLDKQKTGLIITDPFGTVIVHPQPELVKQRGNLSHLPPIQKALNRQEGSLTFEAKGEEMLGSVALTSRTHWVVLVQQPKSQAFAFQRDTGRTLLTALAILVGLALLLGILGSRKIKDLGDRFSRKVEILKSGRLEALPEFSFLTQETAALDREFTEMALAVQKREKELIQSEEKYRRLVQNAKDAIFIAQDGVVKFPNPTTLKLSGYREEELRSLPFTELIHPEDRALVLTNYQKRLQGLPVPDSYEFRILNQNGDLIWVEINAALVTWEERPATLNFLRDITEKKRLVAQLLQAQKMEAVGTLAGGVAHDFNNLLQAIVGNTEILLLDFPDTHPAHSNLMRIRQTSLKARDLVQQLLIFSRKIESRRVPVNLNREIEQTRSLLSRTLPKMIGIELRLTPDLQPVEADPTQVGQVLMNLAINAQDAMPDGGKILIETGNKRLDESFCRFRPGLVPGNYVGLFVSDTGTGMDPETQKRIFEPFFTTKGVGKGTGLGMAMVYGIVKSHQGFIYCQSEPGKGSTFEMYFPAGNHQATAHQAENQVFSRGKGETVLLVDDEPYLLDLGGHILNRFGYRAIKAQNGEEALEILEGNQETIDLIVMDLMMPGMGGRKCLEQVLRLNPEARFIVASGHSQEGTIQEVRELGARGVIQKPYSVEDLLKMVRGALEG